MGFLDNLGKTLTSAGEATANKTKELTELAKLNIDISKEESVLRAKYNEVGMKYYDITKDNPDEDFKNDFDAIAESIHTLAELKVKLQELKNK